MDQTDALLGQVLDLPEDQWSDRLDAICTANPAAATELRRRFAVLQRMGVTEPSDLAFPLRDDSFPETFGPYRLVERLGGGGMGIVYLAQHEALGRRVALKLIRPERLYFGDARERFRREVEAVARLEHPGCVQIHQVGEAEGVPYFAMEHVVGVSLDRVVAAFAGRPATKLTGHDLATLLRQHSPRPVETANSELFAGPWSRVCIRIVLAAAEALAHAHARGVVHRDIKPSNLMVTPEGRVVVIDFGLAVAEGTSRMTRSGAFLGSLPYMAPEQVRGDQRAIDARTDVYALGVCLYELLALVSPFEAASVDTTRENILSGKATPLRRRNPAVGAELALLCSVAMDVDPRRRYQHMADLAADLAATLEHRAIAARPAGPWRGILRWSRRHPVPATVVVLGSLALVVGPLLISLAIAGQRDRAVEAEARARRGEYSANLAAANAALLAGNGVEARRRLDACPDELRGFEWRHLDLALDGALLTVRAHRSEVTAAAIARDGTLLASGARNGEVGVFAARTGERRHTLQTGDDPVGQVEFGAGTRELFTVASGRLRVFDTTTGALRRERPPQAGDVGIFVHPGADGITVQCGDARVLVLDPHTFAPVHETSLAGSTELPAGFFLSDGARLLTPLTIGGVVAWDARTGEELATVAMPVGPLSICVQPGGLRAACADSSGNLAWCELRPGAAPNPLATAGRVVRDIGFVRDGHHLIAGCMGGELLVFSLPTGHLERILYGHRGPVRAVTIGTDDDLVVSGGEDGTLRVWSPYLAPDLTDLGTPPSASIAVTPDRGIVVGTQDGVVTSIAPETGAMQWQTPNPHWINSLALVQRGTRAAFSFHSVLRTLDRQTGSDPHDLELPNDLGHYVHMVADPEGAHLWLATRMGWLLSVDVAASRILARRQVHEGEVFGLARDASSGQLLTVGQDGRIVETAADLATSRVLTDAGDVVSAVLLDGDHLLTSERHALVRRERTTGAELRRQACPDYFIAMAALGGDRIVTGSQDGRIGFWNRSTLEPLVELRQPATAIWRLCVDPDGAWLAATCDQATGRILFGERAHDADLPWRRARVAAGRQLAAHAMREKLWRPSAQRWIEDRTDLSAELRDSAVAALPPQGLYHLAMQAHALGASTASVSHRRSDLIRVRDALVAASLQSIGETHAVTATAGLALLHLRLGDARAALAAIDSIDLSAWPGHRAIAAFTRSAAFAALGDSVGASKAMAELEALVAGDFATDAMAQRLLVELRAGQK